MGYRDDSANEKAQKSAVANALIVKKKVALAKFEEAGRCIIVDEWGKARYPFKFGKKGIEFEKVIKHPVNREIFSKLTNELQAANKTKGKTEIVYKSWTKVGKLYFWSGKKKFESILLRPFLTQDICLQVIVDGEKSALKVGSSHPRTTPVVLLISIAYMLTLPLWATGIELIGLGALGLFLIAGTVKKVLKKLKRTKTNELRRQFSFLLAALEEESNDA